MVRLGVAQNRAAEHRHCAAVLRGRGRSSIKREVASRLASMLHWHPRAGGAPEAAPCVEEAQGNSSVNLEKCPLGMPGQGPCLCFFILKFKDYKRTEAAGWDRVKQSECFAQLRREVNLHGTQLQAWAPCEKGARQPCRPSHDGLVELAIDSSPFWPMGSRIRQCRSSRVRLQLLLLDGAWGDGPLRNRSPCL